MEIVGSNPLNKDSANVRVSHSRFDLERHVLGTYRFGEYAPFFFFDGVGSDKIRQRSVTTTRSLSLNAPLMENINMKRDYFAVYYDAILPHNWQKVYVNPKKGDDVDASLVGCSVVDFGWKMWGYLYEIYSEVFFPMYRDEDLSDKVVNTFLRWIFLIEMLSSKGSLLSSLGVNFVPFLFDVTSYISVPGSKLNLVGIDFIVDDLARVVMDSIPQSGTSGVPLTYQLQSDSSRSYTISEPSDLRLLFDFIRDGEYIIFNSGVEFFANFIDLFVDGDITFGFSYYRQGNSFDLDLARPISYQLACAHFYTNDNIDYLYSCELYRDYVGYIVRSIINANAANIELNFTYNGVKYPYDWFSARYFDYVLNGNGAGVSAWNVLNTQNLIFAYFRAIFGYNRSLRFMDYFTGAKSQPLAVGDVNVAVNDNLVSVVDVTRNIQFQRFLNNINRIPQQLDGYIRKMFPGASPGFDYHNPAWLAHTNDVVFTAEVENTGEAQMKDPNSVTATFRGNSSDKEFTFDCDKPCIIIGIQYFDIRRAYADGVDRLAQHVDRFDRFIPEMQFIGDQEVRGSELVSWLGVDPISYQGRNEEYKQINDIAFGGFASGSLPGWSFLFNPLDWFANYREMVESGVRISPDFIRSKSIELDKYFLILTGFSLGTYFHFIQKIVNITSANRPMVRNPQILG